jgi:hypothetical protein
MIDLQAQAIELAASVYQAFMREVIKAHVLKDRVGELSAKKQKQIAAEREIDARILRLISISGKGGYTADPDLRERYAASANVTLLDHLLSVVRGSIAFAALDILAANPELDRATLQADLRVLAAIAFMHDLDKDLGLQRDMPLPLEAVAERWNRYGLDAFVGSDRPLAPDQVRALIEEAEATQAHRSPPISPPPRAIRNLMGYVQLADKLDGLWLKEGIEAVLARLRKDGNLRTDLLVDWSIIDLFDPHHPFLVDELQRFLSAACEQVQSVPPLFEVHQDGRLVMLIPANGAAEIKAKAIKRLGRLLAQRLFGLRINVSGRAVPELLDARPNHQELTEHMATTALDRDFGRLFLVKVSLANHACTSRLDQLVADLGLAPAWPKPTGQTITPYPDPANLSEDGQRHLRSAAHLLVLLNHKQVKELPDYKLREQQVLAMVGEDRPEWISELEDRASRFVFTGLWARRVAVEDAEIAERIWGEGGLLQRWLEGSEEGYGLRDSIAVKGNAMIEAVGDHFSCCLDQRAVRVEQSAAKRCLFTDLPVTAKASFTPADKLYEIKKSAFSGRDGRLEDIDSTQGEAQVSPVSYAEHRFRSYVYASSARGKPDGIPTLLSSPSTTGLFASLALNNEDDFRTLSVYDLARSKGLVYSDFDVYRHRYRIARFERMPEQIEKQVDLLRLLLQAALRVGRPLHLFRGLPTAKKAFFTYDAMPRRLAELVGGSQLRLEQIPAALKRLETANLILSTNGLGFEVFDRYTRPATRVGGICLAWALLHDRAKDGKADWSMRFRREFEQLIEEQPMTDTEAPLVDLGRAAARIQQRPLSGAAANEELLSFNLSLETAIVAWRLGQCDPESLTMAIAGELETNLARKQKIARKELREGELLRNAFICFARDFVDNVWFGVLNGRPPAQASRRVLAAIYRMSFLTAPRPKSNAEAATDNA